MYTGSHPPILRSIHNHTQHTTHKNIPLWVSQFGGSVMMSLSIYLNTVWILGRCLVNEFNGQLLYLLLAMRGMWELDNLFAIDVYCTNNYNFSLVNKYWSPPLKLSKFKQEMTQTRYVTLSLIVFPENINI